MGTVSIKYIMVYMMVHIRQLTDQLEKKIKDLLEHIMVTLLKICPSLPPWKLRSRRSLHGPILFPVMKSVSAWDKH